MLPATACACVSSLCLIYYRVWPRWALGSLLLVCTLTPLVRSDVAVVIAFVTLVWGCYARQKSLLAAALVMGLYAVAWQVALSKYFYPQATYGEVAMVQLVGQPPARVRWR